MNELSQEELLRRAEYHAKEASRLMEEIFERLRKSGAHKDSSVNREVPSLDRWRSVSHPLCIICKQHHPVGMPCPYMMTMS